MIIASQYSSLLVSGGLHENVETEEGSIQYKITEDGCVTFSNLFTYDKSRVTGMTCNNGDEFTYNQEGIRTSKTVAGVKTEYIIEGRFINADKIEAIV